MKSDTVFKRAFNDALDLIANLPNEGLLPSENEMAALLKVSRTTVRKVIAALADHAIIGGTGRKHVLCHARKRIDRFPETETMAMPDQVERRFMEWMLRDNARPGIVINELDLARRFGVATSSIREFLNRFQRFGLIVKRPNGGWVLEGFTTAFALELFEIREMFEMRSARAFAAAPSSSLLWQKLQLLREEHLLLLREIDERFHDFSSLDSRFHRLVNAAAPNRFVDSFYDVITMIFHYHYQWNKHDERQRNAVAISEHLTFIDALIGRDIAGVEIACRAHLASAKETLLRATAAQARTEQQP
jgi:DNA-binding GntR family transcriptional regulator